MLDLMQRLGMPVVLVARAGLGTINHTLLSLRILRDNGLEVVGVVFNEEVAPAEEVRFMCQDNPRVVAHFGKVDVLGTVPHLPSFRQPTGADWQRLEESLPGLPRLLERLEL